MSGVRLVACDLDGTVVRPDGSISARTVTALAACERAGVDVVFVTGRPPRWMAPVVEATGHRGLAICGNGAIVLDLADGQVLRADPLSAQAVLAIATRLRPLLPGAAFALETLDGYRREPGYRPLHQDARAATVGQLAELLTDSPIVVKMLCRLQLDESAVNRPDVDGSNAEQPHAEQPHAEQPHAEQPHAEQPDEPGRHNPPPELPGQPLGADEMLSIARSALAGLAEPVHSNPAGGLLEISALGVSKASALRRLAAARGLTALDVVAFGDMPNDVPMLRWAGQGYAMADGHPEAIAAASAIAPPCQQDGVAQVLEGLLRLAETR